MKEVAGRLLVVLCMCIGLGFTSFMNIYIVKIGLNEYWACNYRLDDIIGL
jgi:hypothetical protein